MSESRKISVVTVCWNARERLHLTYASLATQTSNQFEWIVVDGASTDNTVEFLQSVSEFPIHWESKPDKGIYHAMNRGIELASGEFVWFLNSGDRLTNENTIQILCDQSNGHDLLYSDVQIDNPDGTPAGMRSEITPHKLPIRMEKAAFKMGMIVSHQAFIPKRTLIPEFDTRYRLSSDLDWMLRILEADVRYHQLTPLARIEHPGASNRMWYRSQWERFIILAKHFGLLATLSNHIKIAARRIRFGKKTRRWH